MMTFASAWTLVRRNVTQSRRHLLFSSVGLVVGTATLSFFLALTTGIRERVINRLYPVNQVEFQPEVVRLFGLGVEVPARLDTATLDALRSLPGVRGVFPKQRTKFQAKLWGGRDVLGYQANLEAFADGLPPDLIAEELRETERAVLGPEVLDGGCDEDSPCRREAYAEAFRDSGDVVGCTSDRECAPPETCRRGVCGLHCREEVPGTQNPSQNEGTCPNGLKCVRGECLALCVGPADCHPGEVCEGEAGSDRVCRRLSCRLRNPRDQFSDDWSVLRGEVSSNPGVPCPEGTYCATWNVLAREGRCVAPIPVILSPFLLEVYNRVAATALGLRRLAGLEVMLGVRFAMLFGESFFIEDELIEKRMVRRARVVGFSPKAMEFGVTMPLPYVVRANAALRGREEASAFTSVVVVTQRNEDIPGLVEDARVLGLTLSPRSEEGRKAANVLTILTVVFAVISLVILAISAIHIAHTFLMLVTERRTEIALYRAVGASLWDIRGLILMEAVWLGILGGSAGLLAGYGGAQMVNALVARFLDRIPGSPGDLFAFSPSVVLVALACAVSFALIGAYVPARAAARTDPATVLTQG